MDFSAKQALGVAIVAVLCVIIILFGKTYVESNNNTTKEKTDAMWEEVGYAPNSTTTTTYYAA